MKVKKLMIGMLLMPYAYQIFGAAGMAEGPSSAIESQHCINMHDSNLIPQKSNKILFINYSGKPILVAYNNPVKRSGVRQLSYLKNGEGVNWHPGKASLKIPIVFAYIDHELDETKFKGKEVKGDIAISLAEANSSGYYMTNKYFDVHEGDTLILSPDNNITHIHIYPQQDTSLVPHPSNI